MHSATGLRRSRPVIHVLICLLLILCSSWQERLEQASSKPEAATSPSKGSKSLAKTEL